MYFVRVNNEGSYEYMEIRFQGQGKIHADFGRFIAHEAPGILGRCGTGGRLWFVRSARLTPAAICACMGWWPMARYGRCYGICHVWNRANLSASASGRLEFCWFVSLSAWMELVESMYIGSR